METINYTEKPLQYFSSIRKDVIKMFPERSYGSVLEIGAGGCDTLVYLKDSGIAGKVTGIEFLKIPNSNQQNPKLDALHYKDIVKDNLDDVEKQHDMLILADVIEHVFDTDLVLQKIKSFIKPNTGKIVLSIPNIQEFTAFYSIYVRGDFAYSQEGGILDDTHIRFFCKKNMYDILQRNGYEIENVVPSFEYVNPNSKRSLFNKFTFRLFEKYLAVQFLFLCHPKA